jgi:hypothetical protein
MMPCSSASSAASKCSREDGQVRRAQDPQPPVEATLHFGLPLERQRRRRHHQRPLHRHPLLQFAPDQAGLDGLAEPDLVGDEQPSGRAAEQLEHGGELVGPEQGLAGGQGVERVGERVAQLGPGQRQRELGGAGRRLGQPEPRVGRVALDRCQ